MKYEAPELTALTPAINAIQDTSGSKSTMFTHADGLKANDQNGGYADWE